MEQFHSDIKLLVRNAQTFNCETSIIYSDSILLGKVYENLCEQLQSGVLPLSTETTTETNEITTASTPRISSRRGRGTRATTTTTTTTTPVATNSEVSRRGRKRKTIVTKEEEDACEDERVISDDSDNQED
jgi:hypothetical protein